MIARKRNGEEVEVYDAQSKALKFLYTNRLGRILLAILIKPFVSRLVGCYMDSALSKQMIKSFIQKNNIDLSQYQKQNFSSYNDCFCRKIKDEFRIFDSNPKHLVSPCDAKLTVYDIDSEAKFSIKGHDYSFDQLLRSKVLADEFVGGKLAIFRLSVDDYHRYSFFDAGTFLGETKIPGVFHTVNPLAVQLRPIYKENTRTYSVLDTNNFGKVVQMEVGALLVGRIVNDTIEPGSKFVRGQEKGHFEFGGSTVVLAFKKDIVVFDNDIIKNSTDDVETIVKMGECIGSSK